jgi:hypothetical protein
MHPQPGQTPLGVHEPLFSHWQQKENAEMMNHWLDTMIHNASLVRAAWDG